MAQLPKQLSWSQATNQWPSILNPLLANPLNQASLLTNLVLTAGTNVIPHKLGRTQQGWFITDIQGVATLYRNAPFNALTLSLDVSAPVTCSIGVF